MFELSYLDWTVVLLAGLVIGITKTGIPGLGVLVAPLMASVMPAKASVGVVLPMLIIGDIFAVAYYRRHAVWYHILRLLPWAIVGMIIGWCIMDKISDQQLRVIIGIIVLVMLGLNLWQNSRFGHHIQNVPHTWWFAAWLGLLAGLTTMLANAAGPIMIIYLLSMGLPKHEFIGTGAWYFAIGNLIKVPFYLQLGLITRASLTLSLTQIPLIALGALLGILVLKRIPERVFRILAQALAAAAAIRLFM